MVDISSSMMMMLEVNMFLDSVFVHFWAYFGLFSCETAKQIQRHYLSMSAKQLISDHKG